MTDEEFDILDELYFIQTFEGLFETTEIGEPELKACLRELIDKGWVKCLDGSNAEVVLSEVAVGSKCKEYNYLATKAGLLAHNTV